jgi:hypothetical protein
MPFQITKGMRSYRLRRAAIAYALEGLKVLALHGVKDGKCDCGDLDCKSPGKHPIGAAFPKGHLDATTSTDRIRRVWKEHPNANIGLVPHGDIGILDFDGAVGLETARSLKLPQTVTVITGRGEHRYFSSFPSKRLDKMPGVDIRAHGSGYVCAPPSMHHSGQRYHFVDGIGLPAPFPDHLKPKSVLSVDFGRRKVPEGGRNNHLTKIAGLLRSSGMRSGAITDALCAVNPHLCQPPLERSEVRRIARSIGRYPTANEEAIGNLADVQPEDVRFLFGPYIPRGALTVLDGQPGQGKSSFCTALVAAVTTGRKVSWSSDRPDGSALIFSAEDDPARVLKPRLIAQGANVISSQPSRHRPANGISDA